MLLDKYRPQSVEEMIGNKAQALEIERFAVQWKKGACLMLHGPTGCGKTLTVRLVAKKLNAELVESHASDDRGLKGIEETLKSASGQQSLMRKKKLILIEDADRVESVKALAELIKMSVFPVLLVAEDPYSKKLYSLRKTCELLPFSRVRSDSIAKFLKAVRDREEIKMDDSAVGHIARTAGGDVRAALNDLESLAAGSSRDTAADVFSTIKILFKTKSMENVKAALQASDRPMEEIMLWLEWNITTEYEKPQEIAQAFGWLAKADVFAARILRTQAWSLAKYTTDLSAAGVALSKEEMYRKFVRYAYPRAFAARAKSAEGLAAALHVSEARVKEYMPLLKAMAKKNMLPEGVKEDDMI